MTSTMTYEMPSTWDQALEQLRSPEHLKLCDQYSAECDRLGSIAARLYSQLKQVEVYCDQHTARWELCSQSRYMHRGFYCPSPIFELIVGNAKRGKILKRITSRRNPTHEYGFDSSGRLLWCKEFYNGTRVGTEYLFYDDNSVYGLTLDHDGYVQNISEETYLNGRLVRYCHSLIYLPEETPSCNEVHCEEFEYDSQGLSVCKWINFHRLSENYSSIPFAGRLPQAICNIDVFQFERKDGWLVSYTSDKGYTYQAQFEKKA